MSKYKELLDRIDKRNYLTEREHREFLEELQEACKKAQAFDILKEHIMLNEDYWNEEIHIHINNKIIDDEEDVKIIKKALGGKNE